VILRAGSEFQRLGRLGKATTKPRTAAVKPNPALWRDDAMAWVEAILVLAREPLTSRKIAQFSSLPDGTAARTVMNRLNRLYDSAGCAFRIEEVAGGYQLFTRQRFGPWLRKLLQSSFEVRWSGPALETLAVIAYRQPILRADIEAIRGVQCGDLLRQLLERDFVRILGRTEDLGRPLMYGTTKRFLQVFGLRHLDDLPRAEQLRIAPRDVAAQDVAAEGKTTDSVAAGITDGVAGSTPDSVTPDSVTPDSVTPDSVTPDSASTVFSHSPNNPERIRFHEEELC